MHGKATDTLTGDEQWDEHFGTVPRLDGSISVRHDVGVADDEHDGWVAWRALGFAARPRSSRLPLVFSSRILKGASHGQQGVGVKAVVRQEPRHACLVCGLQAKAGRQTGTAAVEAARCGSPRRLPPLR